MSRPNRIVPALLVGAMAAGFLSSASTGNATSRTAIAWGANGDIPVPANYAGSSGAELTVYRPSTGRWWIRGSTANVVIAGGGVPVPADYDGDGDADPALFSASTGNWRIASQPDVRLGLSGDIAVPENYVGGREVEVAVWRPSTGQWLLRNGVHATLGLPGDVPVPADYNGDGHADVATYRPSTGQWLVGAAPVITWGLPGDVPVAEDFDGDGSADIAVFRPSTGQWLLRDSADEHWGAMGDIPVPRDYNGDGILDIAVWRPSAGQWWLRLSSPDSQETPTTGVRYSAVRNSRGPLAYAVVRVDLGSGAAVRAGLANDVLPGLERTSSIAQRYGAVAAVNGDFYVASGRPVHGHGANGALIQTPITGHWQEPDQWQHLGLSRRRAAAIGTATPFVDVIRDDGAKLRVLGVNTTPDDPQGAVLYNRQGVLTSTPANSCAAWLRPSGSAVADSDGLMRQTYLVTTNRCARESLPLSNVDVLAAPDGSVAAGFLRQLAVGATISTRTQVGWPGMSELIGGSTTIVRQGQMAAELTGTASLYARNPRTGVGLTSNNELLLVTVDGREAERSAGLTLGGLAALLIRLGAVSAINLDGGGSSTMVIRGTVRNRPSDGSERSVANALLVLPAGAAAPRPAGPPDPAEAATSWRRERTDPASTGGYVHLLRQKGTPLPAELETVRTAP